MGIPEDFSTSSTTAISSLLKEAFKLKKEPLVDRAHRTLQPVPDCVDILRGARAQQRIKIGDMTFSVFPEDG